MSRRKAGPNHGYSLYQRQDGRWVIAYEDPAGDSQPRRRKSLYAATKAEALARYHAALQPTGSAPSSAAPPPPLLLADVVREWLAWCARTVAAHTLTTYRMYLARLTPGLGNPPITSITPQQIDAVLDTLAPVLAPKTLHHHRATLRQCCAYAVRQGYLASNPIARCVPRSVPATTRPYLTRPQILTLLDAHQGTQTGALYMLAALLGLRQGELLGLTWAAVDWSAGTIAITQALHPTPDGPKLGTLKTAGSKRVLALPARAIAALKAQQTYQQEARIVPEQDLCFTRRDGKPLTGQPLTRRFQADCRALDLPVLHFHDLRHTAATFMLALGVDEPTRMAVLGHTSTASARLYAHVQPAALRGAAEAQDAALPVPAPPVPAERATGHVPYPDDPAVLLAEVRAKGFRATGRAYDVSDNAIRRYLKRRDLI